jgi:hypothetical protein
MRFAENTDVSVERSRGEIERLLLRFGASKFQYGWDGDRCVITFKLRERIIQFELPLPDRNDPAFTTTPSGRAKRNPADIGKAWEAAQRRKFRALCLSIKAKLVAVDEGIAEFEDEFLANIVVNKNGATVGKLIKAQIAEAYDSNKAPKMLTLSGGS